MHNARSPFAVVVDNLVVVEVVLVVVVVVVVVVVIDFVVEFNIEFSIVLVSNPSQQCFVLLQHLVPKCIFWQNSSLGHGSSFHLLKYSYVFFHTDYIIAF